MVIFKKFGLGPMGILTALLLLLSAMPVSAATFLYTPGHGLDTARLTTFGGHTRINFSSNDANWATALGGGYGAFSAIMVGEGTSAAVLSPATRADIATYVSNGGKIIVTGGTGSIELAFLNTIFGYSTTISSVICCGGSVAGTLTAGAAGTSFAGGPPTVDNANATTVLLTTPGTRIYEGAGATTLVFADSFGAGSVIFLGYDYCCGSSSTGVDDWYRVLDRALGFTAADIPPVAVDDSKTVSEDDPATTIDVLSNDIDVDGGPISIASVTQPANGTVVITNAGADLTYQPNADYCNSGNAVSTTDDFTYTLTPGSSVGTVRVTVNCVNDAPVATDNAYTGNEDTQQSGNVITDDTGAGVDSDVDGDSLRAVKDTDPGFGTLVLNSDGSFTYDPNLNYCNTGGAADSFTYHVNDGPTPIDGTQLDSNVATVTFTVTCVNDPPVVTSVSPAAQTSDYSDFIGTVTITATDVDDTALTLAQSGAPSALPDPALNTTTSCTTVPNDSTMDGSTCTWTMDGQVLVPGDNAHNIDFTASDDEPSSSTDNFPTTRHVLSVISEDAGVLLDAGNDVAVEVPAPDDPSGSFSLFFSAWEINSPDFPHGGTAQFGNLNNMVPFMTLIPVGPGGPEDGVCTFIAPLPVYPGEGYAQVALFQCDFDAVPVNTYEIVAAVDGADSSTRYYTGFDEDVLVVYDPSLGFTTGGGWFYWPGTDETGYAGDKTNFGFNMKYNKKRTNVQGNLLLMRHTITGETYKVKSNALRGLAIGDGEDASGKYGWAAFSGKSTYRAPGMDTEGNHPFLVYVEDHGEQGCGQDPTDEFWIEVKDGDGNIVLEVNGPDSDPAGPDSATDGDDEPIECGNIIVPHKTGGKGGGGGKKPRG